jgi:hypothetical protein
MATTSAPAHARNEVTRIIRRVRVARTRPRFKHSPLYSPEAYRSSRLTIREGFLRESDYRVRRAAW